MPNIPSRGWYARVTPASGHVHEPSIIQSDAINPQQTPQANAVPRIRLPVPKDDRWRDILGDGTTDVDLDVYHDGARQPIDTLVDVEDAPGHTVLVGEGGRELRTRVEASYDQRAVHLAAQDLIDNNTTYASNVDTPTTTTETNTTLVTLTTTSDFLVRIDNPTAFDPFEAQNGNLEQLQTLFFSEGEDTTTNSGTAFTDRSVYSGDGIDDGDGRAERFSAANDEATWEFVTEHTIPEDQVGLKIREDNDDGGSGYDTEYYLDGVLVDNGSIDIGSVNWRDHEAGDDAGSAVDGWADGENGDLAPGTHEVKIVTPGVSTFHDVDCVVLYDKGTDDRFTASYNFDETLSDGTDGGRYLDGPELYPSEVQVAFDIVPAPQAVTGIRAEATLNGGASGYTHYLSNDQGANFTTGTGANAETDSLGATWGPGITYKAGLSRFGSRSNTTPLSGFTGQNLQALTLKADLEDMPLVVNRTFDGHLDAILRELANIGDQLWEYRWENVVSTSTQLSDGYGTSYGVSYGSGTETTVTTQALTERIEWTSPGQRTATQTPGVSDYQATKTTGEVYQKAIVYGQPDTPVRGERFEADHGNAVGLQNTRLQQGSERVSDPDTDRRYRRGTDYTMDFQAGEITVLSAGDMSDATVYTIDYNYQAFGEYDDGTASPNVTPRIDLPGLWSDFLCKQAARLIINEVSTPIHTATVTLPNDETGWSVVESLDPDIVPTGGNALHVKDVQNTPEATVLTLGSRRGLSDVVGDIRAQVGAVSQKA